MARRDGTRPRGGRGRGRKRGPIRADAILRGLFDDLKLRKAIERQKIVQLWPNIVDSRVAKHAAAERVSGKTLYVAVDSSVWMNELAALKQVLLEKVNQALSIDVEPITDIRFRQDSSVGRRKAPAPPPAAVELTEDQVEEIRQVTSPLEDDKLRNVLEKLMKLDMKLKAENSGQSDPNKK